MYRIQVRVPAAQRVAAEELLLGIADATSTRIVDEDAEICAFSGRRPDDRTVRTNLTATGITARSLRIDTVPDHGWTARSLRRLPPVRAGRFVLRGSHHPVSAPLRHDICIDAGPAFGTGHHPTTAAVIGLLDHLAGQRPRPQLALDMGTGTGILAIVMARLWRCPVLAVDNDPAAVSCARENVARNRVAGWVDVIEADGDRLMGGRFDVTAANLFAGPLRRTAPQLAGSLAPGGSLVLSGLLRPQRLPVLQSYVRRGLSVRRTVHRNPWITLLLDRSETWG